MVKKPSAKKLIKKSAKNPVRDPRNYHKVPAFAEGGAVGDDYNTKLDDEPAFQTWKSKNAPKDSGADYDLRGAYKEGNRPAANGHWDDKFKKPNHPTFSTFSKYAPNAPDKAGTWNGDTYVPNPKR